VECSLASNVERGKARKGAVLEGEIARPYPSQRKTGWSPMGKKKEKRRQTWCGDKIFTRGISGSTLWGSVSGGRGSGGGDRGTLQRQKMHGVRLEQKEDFSVRYSTVRKTGEFHLT